MISSHHKKKYAPLPRARFIKYEVPVYSIEISKGRVMTRIVAAIFSLFLLAGPDLAQAQDLTASGRAIAKNNQVTITAVPDGRSTAGWYKFKVTAVNASKTQKKTVNGYLQLYSSDGKKAGGCTLYVEVPPNGSKEQIFAAKEESKWSNFKVEIKKVYDF